MALYLIGDLQGCDRVFAQLLDKIDFSPSRDTLYLLGDLVNRGPESLQLLRRVIAYGASARCLLGNHDLHLLGVAYGARSLSAGDTLQPVLQAPDHTSIIDWLRRQPLAIHEHGWLMVHAGVLPQWTLQQTLAFAAEVETALRAASAGEFLRTISGNQPTRWHDDLQGADRLRVALNGLTRLRFCTAEGTMEFKHHDDAASAPPGYAAWYDVPERQSAGTRIAFGHWSRQGLVDRPNLAGLDTGCVWGGALTAMHIDHSGDHRGFIQVAGEPSSSLER